MGGRSAGLLTSPSALGCCGLGLLLCASAATPAAAATWASAPGGAPAVAAVSAGGYAGYAMLASGKVLAWGDDLEGQLGDGAFTSAALPVEVHGLSGVVEVAGGGNSAYALERDGTVWAWGDDAASELGDGGYAPRPVPDRVRGLSSIAAVAAGAFSAYAIGRDGSAWAWGDNPYGQLGVGTAPATVPRRMQLPGAVRAVAAGSADTYVLLRDGTVWVAGDNTIGQLGAGNSPTLASGHRGVSATAVPREIPSLSHVVAIAGGGDSGYALRADGSVWAWGDDSFGELGIGIRRFDVDRPVRVRLPAPAVAIAAGASSGYALLRDGAVWAWGDGSQGELGDGALRGSTLPRRVVGLSTVVQIAADGETAFALERPGAVFSWGSDQYGQLGDGSVTTSDVPVRVIGLAHPGTAPARRQVSRGRGALPSRARGPQVRQLACAPVSASLTAVSCVSGSSCWAVGVAQPTPFTERPVIERWMGTSWRAASSPVPVTKVAHPVAALRAVTCTGVADCWAVGSFASGNEGDFSALVEHFEGRRWSLVDSPLRPGAALLFGVSCPRPTDCWAVGQYQATTSSHLVVIEHFDGRRWSLASVPDPSSRASLAAIACPTPSDCWAVGDFFDRSRAPHALIEHFDGAAWSQVEAPSPRAATSSELLGLTCASRRACWAVGDVERSAQGGSSLAEHFDGRRWRIVPSAGLPGASQPVGTILSGVSCAAPSSCFAVGYAVVENSGYRSVVETLRGGSWRIDAALLGANRRTSGYLDGISCVASRCLAVGSYRIGGQTNYRELLTVRWATR